jgi:hypothetical protein
VFGPKCSGILSINSMAHPGSGRAETDAQGRDGRTFCKEKN